MVWYGLGEFMAVAGEMTALISHVRLHVSPPLLVVPGLSRVAPIISILFKIALWQCFNAAMPFDSVLMLQCIVMLLYPKRNKHTEAIRSERCQRSMKKPFDIWWCCNNDIDNDMMLSDPSCLCVWWTLMMALFSRLKLWMVSSRAGGFDIHWRKNS